MSHAERQLAVATGASGGIGFAGIGAGGDAGGDFAREADRAGKGDPADVAREGFEASRAGKEKVVAGSSKNKVAEAGSDG